MNVANIKAQCRDLFCSSLLDVPSCKSLKIQQRLHCDIVCFNAILMLTNSLLKHSLTGVWEALHLDLTGGKSVCRKRELVNNQLSSSDCCHSIPAASQSAEFLNVEPRCKNNKDHIKVMLITQALLLEEDAEVLGRLIWDWGKDSAASNRLFK